MIILISAIGLTIALGLLCIAVRNKRTWLQMTIAAVSILAAAIVSGNIGVVVGSSLEENKNRILIHDLASELKRIPEGSRSLLDHSLIDLNEAHQKKDDADLVQKDYVSMAEIALISNARSYSLEKQPQQDGVSN